MKTSRQRKWILVVLIIIGLLSLFWEFLVPRSIIYKFSLELKVNSLAKDIQIALWNFKAEYGNFPLTADETKVIRTDGPLLVSLLGEVTDLNPRGIKFIDLPAVKDGRYGLTNLTTGNNSTLSTALVDPWGQDFFIILESTGDGQIPNPEYQGGTAATLRHKPLPMVQASTLIYSAGPDRDPNTWKDNVCSWQRDAAE